MVFYCDFHAHSRKFNVFIYGCENRRHSEKYLREQVYPLMLHKNTAEKFSFEDCRFKIQRQKETTGRVVFWNMGITCSYTLEASYGGTNMGSRAFTHFNTDDYEGIGRYFCETLLDFQDPCPVKESLRNKIVTRLLKEGSNADEPANIALSDYSSLSSGGESSSSDEALNNNNNHNRQSNSEQTESSETAEERKRIRRLRSRRDRCRNGAQFTQNAYADFRQVEKFESANAGNNLDMKGKQKMDQRSNKSTPSRQPKSNGAGKKGKKKFKRSLTMTSLPLSFFKNCAESAIAKNHDSEPISNNDSSGRKSSRRKYTNNNHEQNVTKFTIGTSDEDDEDDSSEETARDLEKLFCPLTDDNGAPFDMQDSFLGKMKNLLLEHSLLKLIVAIAGTGEQLSASSCRRVQSEIMASVSRIKSSILGRKGGFLHTYAMMESVKGSMTSSGASGSVPDSLNSASQDTPVKLIPATPRRQKLRTKSTGGGSLRSRSKSPGPFLTNSITVSLPSPAGNRKPSVNHEMKKVHRV